ncbi:hypothetical protein [Streptacidiphilus rugosus]|uniref:hypothetical protein n=1 Tax=Streptacidiphilus rugosus TaxID=405783 RepID=UPI0012F89159|nr:hypothetical protein [Streptacidiphilus rugosus]
MTRRVRPRAAFLTAPLLLAAYGAIRLASHHRAPGLGWTLGHLCFLLSLLAFAPVLVALARYATRPLAGRLVLALAQVGLVGTIGQAVVDLWAGLTSANHAAMVSVWDRVDAVPVLKAWFYSSGPACFVAGLTTLAALAAYGAAPRLLPRWAPFVVLGGMLLGTGDLDFLPVGAALVAVALCAPPAPGRAGAAGQAGCASQASMPLSSETRAGSGARDARTD